jgi:hypothetical protein
MPPPIHHHQTHDSTPLHSTPPPLSPPRARPARSIYRPFPTPVPSVLAWVLLAALLEAIATGIKAALISSWMQMGACFSQEPSPATSSPSASAPKIVGYVTDVEGNWQFFENCLQLSSVLQVCFLMSPLSVKCAQRPRSPAPAVGG